MSQLRALPWVIDVLDDGLRLYRRHIRAFVVATALGWVPISLLSTLVNGVVLTQLGQSWSVLSSLLLSMIAYPLYVYWLAVLSRMSAQAAGEGKTDLRAALPMRPGRVFGMGCYVIIFAFVAFLILGVIGIACICSSTFLFGIGFRFTTFGAPTIGLGLVFLGSAGLAYLTMIGSIVLTAVYAVQSFAHEQGSFGTLVSRGNDLLFFRLGRNLLCFIAAGAIFGTISLAYVGSLWAAGTLLFQALDLQTTPVLASVLLSLASSISFVVLLPPLPIWMTLMYLRLRTEREGSDLHRRIAAWNATGPGSPTRPV